MANLGIIVHEKTPNCELQNEMTGTQISFSTNFGGKLSFVQSFIIFLERLPPLLLHIFSLLLPVQIVSLLSNLVY